MRVGNHSAITDRRGFSSIIVELLLIVVALILSVILGGFVFGTMSFYFPPAEVEAQTASCSAVNGAEVCQLTLINTGAHSAAIVGCTINIGGSRVEGTLTNGGIVPGSSSLSNVGCTAPGATAQTGSSVVGWVSFTSGFSVYFTARSS